MGSLAGSRTCLCAGSVIIDLAEGYRVIVVALVPDFKGFDASFVLDFFFLSGFCLDWAGS